jgi:hypothetical protein
MRNQQNGSDDAGGHMSATGGTIIHTPDAALPFRVVLTHENSAPTEHDFATSREAEAFARSKTPVPAARSTVFDHAEVDLIRRG